MTRINDLCNLCSFSIHFYLPKTIKMKKTLLLLSLAGLLFTACQQIPAPVDLEAEKAAAQEMLDSFTDVMTTQDVDSMRTFIAKDALICGSDPAEFWDKEAAMKLWDEMSAGPEVDFLFMDKNPLKIAPDGNSAVAIQQFYIPAMMPKLPARNVYYLTKTEGKWMISMWSSSLIPKNEDLAKIIKAVAGVETEGLQPIPGVE